MVMQARLASETDLAGFREEARALLAHQVPPDGVEWQTAHAQNAEFFSDPSSPARKSTVNAASAIVPASFLRLCEVVVLHHDPERFALLYRLLWRLVHEPSLRHDPVDADMQHAHQMAQAVRRDIHKMKAFVKFREIDFGAAQTLQVAFYEPTHHILEAVAPWFSKRMHEERWVIFTPELSVESDGHKLHFAPGLPRAQAPTYEERDSAWLAAYGHIFGDHAIAVNDSLAPPP
ncbi:TIGR03915 family putative DNA repair protein [Ramlibacter sp. PS4R-6]|uniref:TIGR03915 family putative DNA repair protein n=1 Tax=Ramlibacter sp. PS4R-6 TaxID=3133438 RepID=UPI0030AED76E